ncbi:uncharacterized protein [Arachis hypogaea]|uniref:uncharacterized protein n=1 Tax=Arachis hypogaea TaxID=3818 RepID=UPI000DECE09B|nr:uncharacterized protein LOC112705382 [Arachis hypogaea]
MYLPLSTADAGITTELQYGTPPRNCNDDNAETKRYENNAIDENTRNMVLIPLFDDYENRFMMLQLLIEEDTQELTELPFNDSAPNVWRILRLLPPVKSYIEKKDKEEDANRSASQKKSFPENPGQQFSLGTRLPSIHGAPWPPSFLSILARTPFFLVSPTTVTDHGARWSLRFPPFIAPWAPSTATVSHCSVLVSSSRSQGKIAAVSGGDLATIGERHHDRLAAATTFVSGGFASSAVRLVASLPTTAPASVTPSALISVGACSHKTAASICSSFTEAPSTAPLPRVRSAGASSSKPPPLFSTEASSATTKTTAFEFRCGGFGGGRGTLTFVGSGSVNFPCSIATTPLLVPSPLPRVVPSTAGTTALTPTIAITLDLWNYRLQDLLNLLLLVGLS